MSVSNVTQNLPVRAALDHDHVIGQMQRVRMALEGATIEASNRPSLETLIELQRQITIVSALTDLPNRLLNVRMHTQI